MSLQIASPFQQFFDRDGSPLDNGFVYVGVANQNPETNQLTIYFDDALTIPAAQPLRTSNGYIVHNGSPARLYTSQEDFSLTVREKNGVLVYTVADATSLSNLVIQLASGSGSSLVGYNQGGIGAINRTVQSRLRDFVSVKDFGAVGDGVTDDSAAIQAAIDASSKVYFPAGSYLVSASINITKDGVTLSGENNDTTQIKSLSPSVNTISFNTKTVVQKFVIQDIFINNGSALSGHCFAQEVGLAQASFVRVRAYNANPAKSIYKLTDGQIYIDNHWFEFDLIHVVSSTAYAVDLTDSVGGYVNSNSWQNGRVTHCGVPFFNIESKATNYEYDNVFKSINFEVTVGGGIRALGAQNLHVEDCFLYDCPNAGDFIFLSDSSNASPVKSVDCKLIGVCRRSSTLAVGAVDIRLDTGACQSITIIGGDNATLSGFSVDLGSNTGVVLIGTRNWTITNRSLTTVEVASYAGKYGVNIGGSVLYTYDATELNRAKIGASAGLTLEGPEITLLNGTSVGLFAGAGSPNGVVTASVGALYMRTDGGAGNSFYVKESGTGSSGWVPK